VHPPSAASSPCEEARSISPIGRAFAGSEPERAMFSKREFLVFAVGLVLATALTILGTFYFLKNYILLHDSRDPLVKQGGLKPSQEIKR
jgi:hypothetical protein